MSKLWLDKKKNLIGLTPCEILRITLHSVSMSTEVCKPICGWNTHRGKNSIEPSSVLICRIPNKTKEPSQNNTEREI